jgi:dissimilatory sulfite reductase (desulfoviridin) alpha/beta subunit
MAALTIKPEEEKRVKGLGFLSNKGTDLFSGRVITRNGKITAAEMACIAQAAEKFGNGNVVFTTRLTVEVQGIPFEKIEDFRAFIAKEGLKTGGTGAKVRPVVSCKGTTCQYGLIDTFALSEEIHRRFFEGYGDVRLPHKFKIAVGGCPNNCVKPDLNDLGIVGQRIPNFNAEECKGCKKCRIEDICPMGAPQRTDGKINIDTEICTHCGRCAGKCYFKALPDGTNGFKVYVGGRWGKRVAQGQPLSKIFSSEEEVLSVVEKAILLFREQGRIGERFSQTIDRIGFEKAEEMLLSDDILSRKEAILAADLQSK